MLFSNDILIPFIVSLYQWLSTLVSGEVSHSSACLSYLIY